MKLILLLLVSLCAYAEPTINAQPKAAAIEWGGTTTLTVEAKSQSALRYQWYLNGGAISAATAPTLKIDTAVFANAGFYYVTVTDDRGETARSSIVKVTVKQSEARREPR